MLNKIFTSRKKLLFFGLLSLGILWAWLSVPPTIRTISVTLPMEKFLPKDPHPTKEGAPFQEELDAMEAL